MVGNPYNHQKPITSSDRFIGRQKEIENIEYNLDLAISENPQFVNVGITGKEGAGKTSLSYIVEEMAEERDFKTVRMKLDKGIVGNEIQFFERLYQSIVSEIGGKTETNFLQALGGAVDKIEINLKFVRAYMNNSSNSEVSDQIVRSDLDDLSAKLDAPGVMIILDNAQHLGHNPILLQKLNNIFENTSNYFLVLVGTQKMFTEIESAFSPTARMFDKYRLEPFDDYEATAECILKPLRDHESPPSISKKTIGEIHHLTNGRPYEINLILFHMFKISQENSQRDLKLKPDVIGRVVNQMEEWRRPVNNRLPNKIDNLSRSSLEILLAIFESEPITKDNLINYCTMVEYNNLEIDSISSHKDRLENTINRLLEEGIVEETDAGIKLSGGTYTKTYLKYHLYSEGVLVDLEKSLLEENVDLYPCIHHKLIDGELSGDLEDTHSHFQRIDDSGTFGDKRFVRSSAFQDHSDVPSPKFSLDLDDDPLVTDESSDNLIIAERNFDRRVRESSVGKDTSDYYTEDQRITLRLDIQWLNSSYKVIFHSESPKSIDKLEQDIRNSEKRLQAVGVNIEWENQFVLAEEALAQGINGNDEEARRLAEKAVEKSGGRNPEAWFTKSQANKKLNNPETALSDINEALDIIQESADYRLLKSEILLDKEKEEKALKEYEKVIDIDSTNADLWARICHQLCQAEVYSEAKELGERGLVESGGNDHLKIHLAEAELKHDNYETSIEYCSEVIGSQGKFSKEPRVWSVIGYSYLKEDEPRKAKMHLSRYKSEPEIMYHLGWAEAELGNRSAAKELLSEAVNREAVLAERVEDNEALDELEIQNT